MADKSKISRRQLLTFWRRKDDAPQPEPAPSASTNVNATLALGWDRPWPRERIPGPSLGRPLPLRPPGTMQEYILRDACTRCGNCVEACPADAIHMLDASWGPSAQGTPFIDPRKSPCVVCDGFKCTQVCPSGSLQGVFNADQIHMGTASIDRDRCVTHHGQACTACELVCPVPGAIRVDEQGHPRVDEHRCIGCGLCVRACPTEPTSIDVVPRD